MAIELTDAQKATVDSESLVTPPSYYSAALQTQVQISDDFEAFLILSTTDMKTSAIQWISKAATLQTVNKDRDALTSLAITQETLNATNKMNALNVTLGTFNTFRTNFQVNSNFASIPEVQQFLSDLQAPIEELAAASDRAQFDAVMSQVVQNANNNLVITPAQIQELQSWTGVLSKYL